MPLESFNTGLLKQNINGKEEARFAPPSEKKQNFLGKKLKPFKWYNVIKS